MSTLRLPVADPRTVAREIPGIFDSLFPQLTPGVVVNFNQNFHECHGCQVVPNALVGESKLQHAMLFELAIAVAEQFLVDVPVDWNAALSVAIQRQRRHFDAKVPSSLTDIDKEISTRVATNLVDMLDAQCDECEGDLIQSPRIPGYQWISSGVGDFAVGKRLIEVKCTNRPFSSADYRQVLMYWLLSYAAAIEGASEEWSDIVLLNPRLNRVLKVPITELINVTGAGRTKVDILEMFSSMVSDHSSRLLEQI